MARFYVELPLVVGSSLELPETVIRHLHVLRWQQSRELILFNGDGFDYSASLSSLDRRRATVSIRGQHQLANESPLQLTLLIALLANDKFDLVIQKAVELGGTQIIPVNSQYSQRLKAEKISNRFEHWQKIVIAASEQCGRASLTQIMPVQELTVALASSQAQQKFILSPHHAGKLAVGASASVALAIGPEGGFSQEEVTIANRHGFASLLLGPRILRAETAAIAGLSLIQANFGDW